MDDDVCDHQWDPLGVLSMMGDIGFRLLKILRVLYRVYDQLVILMEIRDLNGNSIRTIRNSNSVI